MEPVRKKVQPRGVQVDKTKLKSRLSNTERGNSKLGGRSANYLNKKPSRIKISLKRGV